MATLMITLIYIYINWSIVQSEILNFYDSDWFISNTCDNMIGSFRN